MSATAPKYARAALTPNDRYASRVPPCCDPAALCDACYGRELRDKRGQADVLGQQWAERVGRRPEFRDRAAWSDDARALAMAAAKVAHLAPDPRLRVELAKAVLAGAAAWWARRPARYRSGN